MFTEKYMTINRDNHLMLEKLVGISRGKTV